MNAWTLSFTHVSVHAVQLFQSALRGISPDVMVLNSLYGFSPATHTKVVANWEWGMGQAIYICTDKSMSIIIDKISL